MPPRSCWPVRFGCSWLRPCFFLYLWTCSAQKGLVARVTRATEYLAPARGSSRCAQWPQRAKPPEALFPPRRSPKPGGHEISGSGMTATRARVQAMGDPGLTQPKASTHAMGAGGRPLSWHELAPAGMSETPDPAGEMGTGARRRAACQVQRLLRTLARHSAVCSLADDIADTCCDASAVCLLPVCVCLSASSPPDGRNRGM